MAVKASATKRKVTASQDDSKKVKKAKTSSPVVPKETKTTKRASDKPATKANKDLTGPVSTKKSPRKRAADYFEEEENSALHPETKTKPSTKKAKTQPKKKAEDKIEVEAGPESDDDVIPSQALDMFGEYSDSESESESGGLDLESIPKPPKDQIQAAKAAGKKKSSKEGEEEGTGTLYIGHIPHGFYEKQMKEYFAQFGKINRLRLSRNRRTGAAKHYAFIEFESAEVADIVQRTMNKYLMFGHILQVRLVPQEQVHKDLWKGANKRFKKIPWGSIRAKKEAAPRTREAWKEKVEREEKKRAQKKKKLMEDYAYDFDMPTLKQVDSVQSRGLREGDEVKAIENGTKDVQLEDVIGAAPEEKTAEPKAKKGKKSKAKA